MTPLLLWTVIGVILLASLLWALRDSWALFWLRVRYEIPLAGKLAALARDDHRDAGSNWFRSERELCADFYRFHPDPMPVERFQRATSYLSKAQELGRRELPWYGWAVIFILLVAEALSFGILLAGYAAQNASLREQTWLGYLVATVFAIALLVLTHATGRQLHSNSLLAKAREWFSNRPARELERALRPIPGVSLEHDSRDDNEPIYIQLAARARDHSGGKFQPSYVLPVITAFVVFGFGVLSFYIRSELFEQIQTEQTLERPAADADNGDSSPNSQDIKSLLQAMTAGSTARGEADIKASATRAALAAFGVLSILFIIMQLVGVGVGLFFGFSGRESAAAARIRGQFSTSEEFLRHHRSVRDAVARVAQSKLERLQRRLRSTTTAGNFGFDIEHRVFRVYASEQARARAVEITQSSTPVEPSPSSHASPVPPTGANEATITVEDEAALRLRIEREVREALRAEREAQIRAEIEERERVRLQRQARQ